MAGCAENNFVSHGKNFGSARKVAAFTIYEPKQAASAAAKSFPK